MGGARRRRRHHRLGRRAAQLLCAQTGRAEPRGGCACAVDKRSALMAGCPCGRRLAFARVLARGSRYLRVFLLPATHSRLSASLVRTTAADPARGARILGTSILGTWPVEMGRGLARRRGLLARFGRDSAPIVTGNRGLSRQRSCKDAALQGCARAGIDVPNRSRIVGRPPHGCAHAARSFTPFTPSCLAQWAQQ